MADPELAPVVTRAFNMVRRAELWDIWDPQDDHVLAHDDDDDEEASWCPHFLVPEEEEEERDDEDDLDTWLLEDAWMRQAC